MKVGSLLVQLAKLHGARDRHHGEQSQARLPSALDLSFKNLSVRGFALPSYGFEQLQAATGAVLQAVRTAQLHLMVGESFPLAQAAAAHEAMGARRTVGKVVLHRR